MIYNCFSFFNELDLLEIRLNTLDDIEWCKKNFSDIPNAIFFTGDYKHPIEDLRFMSLCKHHIIANSTFSWWGAYLSDDTGVTIYPSSWYNADERATRIPKSWIAV